MEKEKKSETIIFKIEPSVKAEFLLVLETIGVELSPFFRAHVNRTIRGNRAKVIKTNFSRNQ